MGSDYQRIIVTSIFVKSGWEWKEDFDAKDFSRIDVESHVVQHRVSEESRGSYHHEVLYTRQSGGKCGTTHGAALYILSNWGGVIIQVEACESEKGHYWDDFVEHVFDSVDAL